MTRVCFRFLCLIAILASYTWLRADDNRPIYIEITELEPEHFQTGIRLPGSVPAYNQPELILPDGCESTPVPEYAGSSYSQYRSGMVYQSLRCEKGLEGQRIEVRYPLAQPALPTVVRIAFLGRKPITQVLTPDESSFDIPASETPSGVAVEYLRLGVHHIWAGIDHLLFVLCLLFIAGNFKRILLTVTGFTVAHSLTLGLSVIEVVQLSMKPVEVLIALSVVFLAVEVCKGRRENLTWRFPMIISILFGLLHGLGFAAALNQVGLPEFELMTGLLFCNLGIEAGQILFVALVVVLLALAEWIGRRMSIDATAAYLQKIVGYGAGCLAMVWFLERLFTN